MNISDIKEIIGKVNQVYLLSKTYRLNEDNYFPEKESEELIIMMQSFSQEELSAIRDKVIDTGSRCFFTGCIESIYGYNAYYYD